METMYHIAPCENGLGRPQALSEACSSQLAKFKFYIREGVRLSEATILTIARNFYRDEHSADPARNALGSACFHLFSQISQAIEHSIDTINVLHVLRQSSATEWNVKNFFERVARTAVKYGFSEWNSDFDRHDSSSDMIK